MAAGTDKQLEVVERKAFIKQDTVVGKIKNLDKLEAKDFTRALAGSEEQVKVEEKTIVLRMTPGNRPEVMFTGFWTGKYLRAALDSISKAFRLRRSKMHPARRENTPTGVKKEGKGDV